MTNKAVRKLAAEILLLAFQDFKNRIDTNEASYMEAFEFLTSQTLWHEILSLRAECIQQKLGELSNEIK